MLLVKAGIASTLDCHGSQWRIGLYWLSTPLQQPQGQMPAGEELGLFWQLPDQARPEVGLMILAVWALLFGVHRLAASTRPGMPARAAEPQ